MSLLTDLAQICARISDLNPTADGMRGCVSMEPKLLGETTADYELGCFKVGPDGMTFDPPANNTRPATSPIEAPQEEEEEEEEGEEPSEEEVIASINETAEQGLAFLGSLLGIDFSGRNSTDKVTTEAAALQAASTAAPAARAYNPRINEV
jgi:Domain of unknown function (DUF4773)